MNRAVFLDRDGTLIRDKHYLHEPSEVEWLPGAIRALRRLHDAGFLLVVVTNQSGVGRGLFAESKIHQVHRRMERDLKQDQDVTFSGLYYATVNPERADPPREKWRLRKPRPGMLERASRDLDIDCAQSFMVGNKPSDVEAGRRAGCSTVLVTGPEKEPEPGAESGADAVVEGMEKAAEWITKRNRSVEPGEE